MQKEITCYFNATRVNSVKKEDILKHFRMYFNIDTDNSFVYAGLKNPILIGLKFDNVYAIPLTCFKESKNYEILGYYLTTLSDKIKKYNNFKVLLKDNLNKRNLVNSIKSKKPFINAVKLQILFEKRDFEFNYDIVEKIIIDTKKLYLKKENISLETNNINVFDNNWFSLKNFNIKFSDY